MSIKIHGGFSIPQMSMAELLEFCQKVHKDFITIQKTSFHKKFIEVFIEDFDHAILRGETPTVRHYLSETLEKCRDKIKKEEQEQIRLGYDFSAKATFFPRPDKIMGIFFSDNEDFNIAWRKLVNDYHYQNSTDGPKDVSPEDWTKRRNEWDEVLAYSGIPSSCGFSYTLADGRFATWDHCPKIEEVQTLLPDLDERARRCLTIYAMDQKFFDKKYENGMSDFMHDLRETQQELQDNPELKTKYVNEIKEKLSAVEMVFS